MVRYENNPKEYLSKLSNEEFRELLEDAGFEVSDGEGKIIFTDTHRDFQYEGYSEGRTYSLKLKNRYEVKESEKIGFVTDSVA